MIDAIFSQTRVKLRNLPVAIILVLMDSPGYFFTQNLLPANIAYALNRGIANIS
ncbi:MAG: hypothetical protein GY761_08365 [Hyphomicrobiales bacterium]|nr:hypothetical protein [Hyphomicrobiales bacterium]